MGENFVGLYTKEAGDLVLLTKRSACGAMQNAKCKMQNECRMQSAECRIGLTLEKCR